MTLSAYVQNGRELSDSAEKVVCIEITKDDSGILLIGYNWEGIPVSKTRHRNTETAKQRAREFGIGEEHWFEV